MRNLQRVKRWETADRKAKSDIILSISPTELKQVKGCNTSREVWNKLSSIYKSKGPARKATLLKQLTLQRMEDDVREYLRKFFDTVDKLSDMKVDIKSGLINSDALMQPSTVFRKFSIIESCDELPTPDMLRIKIVEEHDARKNDTRVTGVMIAKRFGKRGNPNEKKGNVALTIRRNLSSTSAIVAERSGTKHLTVTRAPKTVKRPQRASRRGRWPMSMRCACSRACRQKFQKSKKRSRRRKRHTLKKWCLDNRCTSHLYNNSEKFVHLAKVTADKLNLVNNTTAKEYTSQRGSWRKIKEFKSGKCSACARLEDAQHKRSLGEWPRWNRARDEHRRFRTQFQMWNLHSRKNDKDSISKKVRETNRTLGINSFWRIRTYEGQNDREIEILRDFYWLLLIIRDGVCFECLKAKVKRSVHSNIFKHSLRIKLDAR